MNAQHIQKLMQDAKHAEIREQNANAELERTRALLKSRLETNEAQAERIAELEAALEVAENRPVEAEQEVITLGKQLRFVQGCLKDKGLFHRLGYCRDAILILGSQIQIHILEGRDKTDEYAAMTLALGSLKCWPKKVDGYIAPAIIYRPHPKSEEITMLRPVNHKKDIK